MKIAVISMIRDAWGGSEQLWYEMAKHAITMGHEIIHVAYETPDTAPQINELTKMGLQRIERPGWIPPGSSKAKRTLYLGKNYLRKKLASPIARLFELSPDLVLYNGTCYSIAAEKELLALLVKHKTPFFLLGHLNSDAQRGITEEEADRVRTAYLLAKKVFFVSERSQHLAQRHLCMEIPNAEIIRNPVNMRSADPLPFPTTDILQLANVANLVTAHKGQDLLLEALSSWSVKNWHLNLYGKGTDELYIRKLASHLGIEAKVSFHGSVPDVRKIWECNQVLILSSHMEGMPLAVVEAMLCARVCIVTDVGGNSEWITDGKSGYLIDAPQVGAIVKTLERAGKQTESWDEIGKQAHRHAIERYDALAGTTLLNRIIAP